jgi:hypothetical protein
MAVGPMLQALLTGADCVLDCPARPLEPFWQSAAQVRLSLTPHLDAKRMPRAQIDVMKTNGSDNRRSESRKLTLHFESF